VIAWKQEHDAAPRLLLTTKSVDLRSSEDDADALIAELAEHNRQNPEHPVAIIAIDTLNRAFGGGNENAPDDMGAFVNIVAKIASALGCLVLVVHHSGKDEARGSRGHSSLQAATNVEIEIKREQGEPGIIKITKQRDGVDGAEYGFALKTVLMGVDQDGQDVTTCVAVEADAEEIKKAKRQERGPTGKNQKIAWAAMIELEATGTKSPGVMGIPEGVMIVAEERLFDVFAREITDEKPTRRERESFRRAIEALQRGGWIKTKGGNLWRC